MAALITELRRGGKTVSTFRAHDFESRAAFEAEFRGIQGEAPGTVLMPGRSDLVPGFEIVKDFDDHLNVDFHAPVGHNASQEDKHENSPHIRRDIEKGS